jgi:ABC-type nickel/cobalt efflux system permease component RcnA
VIVESVLHSNLPPLALIAFGFLLGMRHALEPDHLAAVATLVTGGRRRVSASAIVGAFWGLGHTLSILLLGGTLLWLRMDLPQRTQAFLELAVAGMLVFLGGNGLVRAYRLNRTRGETHVHGDGPAHSHAGDPTHLHIGPFALGLRPLLIGLVHGLAGTGALTSLVMATLPTVGIAVAYLASFGLGSLLGMGCVTLAVGASLTRFDSARSLVVLMSTTGMASLAFGIYWGNEQLVLLR